MQMKCVLLCTLEKDMKSRNDWFTECRDKDGDLRVLLFALLQKCLGMKSYNSSIRWNEWKEYVNDRPFINKFKEDKKSERVFTDSILAYFVFLCVKRDEKDNINEYLNKAVDIIRTSKYYLDLEEYSDENKLRCKMSDILLCMKCIGNNEGFTEKCRNCTVSWLVRNLRYIEHNYESIISHGNILQKYPDIEQKKLVDKIYGDIQEYEKKSPDKLCDINLLFSLFNSCIRSYDILDVADEKLAYIKWYTAHLSNWPFFKACLLHLNHYDEFSVYQMFHSASDILHVVESDNEELLSLVENDKIVSFLTLGYVKPFFLFYCGEPKDIEKGCIKSLYKIKLPLYRLRIYIALWNLHSHLGLSDLSEYETEIRKITHKVSDVDIRLLNTEFQLYRYYYDLAHRNTVKRALLSTVDKYMETSSISETYDVISELFLQYDGRNSANENLNDNPAALYLEIKGRKSFDTPAFIIPDKPSRYHRIFSDYTLSCTSFNHIIKNYYESRKDEIMNHYKTNFSLSNSQE